MGRLHQTAQRGFTLIELSIVLVIIGLIVGGILAGQSLIRAATLRAQISDIEKLKTAINTYRLKYNALPGDDPNAQVFFGVTACPDYSLPQYCNGNGNGYIDFTASYEPIRASQHLALAGLIPGSYSALWGDPTEKLLIPSRFQNGFLRLSNARQWSAPGIFGRATGGLIELGGTSAATGSTNTISAVTGSPDFPLKVAALR